LEYLGHIISAEGVATDPHIIQVVQNLSTPTDSKQLRAFLGLAGYYRKFIKNYGIISRPLTDLLKKNVQFTWTPQLQMCFDTLKQALISAPVLALPNFKQPFTIEADASDKVLTVKFRQPSHEFTFGVGMSFIPYPLVLTPVV
jgi:hypothetical protein